MMPRYKVRDGAVLAYGGKVLEAGAEVVLTVDQASDQAIAAAVAEVDALGNPMSRATDDARFEAELAAARKHERISILEQERERVAARLAQLDAAIAAETAQDKE
jgi:hypothetical protein